jgi:hypothetical protein
VHVLLGPGAYAVLHPTHPMQVRRCFDKFRQRIEAVERKQPGLRYSDKAKMLFDLLLRCVCYRDHFFRNNKDFSRRRSTLITLLRVLTRPACR